MTLEVHYPRFFDLPVSSRTRLRTRVDGYSYCCFSFTLPDTEADLSQVTSKSTLLRKTRAASHPGASRDPWERPNS